MYWTLLGLVAIGAGLQYQIWYGAEGWPEHQRLTDAVAAQAAENHQLQARNETLLAEVQDLRSGLDAVEARARQDLGMIREGETLVLILDTDAP